MTNDQLIRDRLALHAKIMEQLEKNGLTRDVASREAMRRMKDHPKWNNPSLWKDFFTAVEIEGIDLPMRD